MESRIEKILRDFDCGGVVVDKATGPVVTTYFVELDADTRVSKLERLADDIALRVGTDAVRVIANAQGRPHSAIEVPNERAAVVPWEYVPNGATLPLLLGVGTTGEPVVHDLAKAPHALIAGATGSGKSVLMHAILCGLLTRHNARDLRLVLIDPKRLEFPMYAGMPHLLGSVVTETRGAREALGRLVDGMEKRYEILEREGARNIAEYRADGGHMPYVVVVVDEWADLVATGGKRVEEPVVRLAQKARAAGIHLILATQRPTADVVTGLIKANFPVRIALAVASKVDSRVILDCNGAQALLGRGDMLVSGFSRRLERVHGSYCKPDEVLAALAAQPRLRVIK